MKYLVLVRHGKPAPPVEDDFGRELIGQGIAQSQSIRDSLISWLAHNGFSRESCSIIWSPAVRAVQTAEIIAEGLGLTLEKTDDLYQASAPDILDIASAAADTAEVLIIVGHNPTMEKTASYLIRHMIGMGTGDTVVISLDINGWDGLSSASEIKYQHIHPHI